MSRDTSIEELLQLVARLTAGEPSARCPVGEGPLAPLAEALNHLAAQLEARHAQENDAFGVQALVEQAPSTMSAYDATGNIRFINGRELGLRLSDLQGKSILEFVPENDRERVKGFIHRVLEHGETIAYEGQSAVSFGPEWFAVKLGPVRSGEQIVGFTLISTDISDLKRTQLRLEQSNRELESFAYVASHDLQEPLRKIQTFGERLKTISATLSPESRDYLERMQAAATRMRGLIDDLLAFSRVSSSAQTFSSVDLNAIARDVEGDLEAAIEQAGATVTLGPLPTLEADPTQMRQLLQNLVGNALKFRQDGVPPAISVRHTSPEGAAMCELVVEDNGIGFEEKYVDRIFNVFQRLHGRGKYEGTGIGLAICRRIVERHGGSIRARSTPGQGSTFIVTLPLKQRTSNK